MELIMAEHRKTARKAATLKSPVKHTRKPATRTTGTTQRKASSKQASPKRWSQRVTKESDALDLKHGVFKLTDPKKIAASLKRSAERSSRRKTGAFRSALSMLTFYINPGRQDAAENPTRPAAARQDRAEAAVSSRVILSVVPANAGTHNPQR